MLKKPNNIYYTVYYVDMFIEMKNSQKKKSFYNAKIMYTK